MKYITKPDNWFIPYSLAELEDDYREDSDWNSGLFYGWRICKKASAEAKKDGEIYHDGEICSFDEFWELTDEDFEREYEIKKTLDGILLCLVKWRYSDEEKE